MKHKMVKDFKDTSYKNPTTVRKEKKKKKKFFLVSTITAFIVTIVLIFIFLISPYFKIKKIDIVGIQSIKEEHLQQIIDFEMNKGTIFRHNNIFLFNKANLERNIAENYLLESLEIKKQFYPAQIQIVLAEKVSALAFLTPDNCFNIDLLGFIIEKCNQLSHEFIQIRDEKSENKKIGDHVLTQDDVRYIIQLNESLESQGIGVRTFKVVSNNSSDIRVLTEKGYEIYFNQKMTIEEQLVRFNVLVREEIGPDNMDKVNYIDLRFGEKIFYR